MKIGPQLTTASQMLATADLQWAKTQPIVSEGACRTAAMVGQRVYDATVDLARQFGSSEAYLTASPAMLSWVPPGLLGMGCVIGLFHRVGGRGASETALALMGAVFSLKLWSSAAIGLCYSFLCPSKVEVVRAAQHIAETVGVLGGTSLLLGGLELLWPITHSASDDRAKSDAARNAPHVSEILAGADTAVKTQLDRSLKQLAAILAQLPLHRTLFVWGKEVKAQEIYREVTDLLPPLAVRTDRDKLPRFTLGSFNSDYNLMTAREGEWDSTWRHELLHAFHFAKTIQVLQQPGNASYLPLAVRAMKSIGITKSHQLELASQYLEHYDESRPLSCEMAQCCAHLLWSFAIKRNVEVLEAVTTNMETKGSSFWMTIKIIIVRLVGGMTRDLLHLSGRHDLLRGGAYGYGNQRILSRAARLGLLNSLLTPVPSWGRWLRQRLSA